MKNNKTKDKILLSAGKLFSANGFDGTSIDELSQYAGITKSLLYYYYTSKNEILEDLMKISLENTIVKLHKAIEENPPNDKREFAISSLSVLEEEKDILKIALSEALKTSSKTEHIFNLACAILDEYKNIFDLTANEKFLYCLFIFKAISFFALKEKLSNMLDTDVAFIERTFMEDIEPLFDKILKIKKEDN